MFKKIVNYFDKERFIFVGKIILILVFGVIMVNIVPKAYSRYESSVNVSAEADVAFFVVKQGTYENTLSLKGLTPSTEPFYYTFYVRNYNEDNVRTDVNLSYDIQLETTTNLPLTYEIIRNESFTGEHTNLITEFTDRQDEDGVYYKTSNVLGTYNFGYNSNQIDSYILKINFPDVYKNEPEAYQGVIELFSVIINATQVA